MQLATFRQIMTLIYTTPVRVFNDTVGKLIRKVPIAILVGLVLGIAALSQFLFDGAGEPSTPAALLALGGVFILTWLLAYAETTSAAYAALDPAEAPPPPGEPAAVEQLRAYPARSFLLTISIAAILFSAVQARNLDANLAAGLAWLLGVGLFLAACFPTDWKWSPDSVLTKLRAEWISVVYCAVVLGVAGVLRLYRLDLPEVGMEQDAANFGASALRYLNGERLYLFGIQWFMNVPAVYTILQAGLIRLFGPNEFGLGALSAIQGILNVLLVFLLMRRMFGAGPALIAGLLVAVAPHHLYYSRTGENNLVVPLFMTAVLYFLHRGVYSGRAFDFALAGVSFGLGQWLDYNNKSAQLNPILLGILAYLFVRQWPYWKNNYLRLGIAAIGAILALIPLLSGLAYNNALFLSFTDVTHGRLIFSNLDRAASQYGADNIILILLHQVERSVLGITHINSGAFSNPFRMMDSMTAVFFFIGLAYSFYRWRDTRYGVILLWWLIGLQASVLSVDPPLGHRLIIALIPSYLLAAIGIFKTGQLWIHSLNWNHFFYRAVIAAALLLYIIQANVAFYFSPLNYPIDWRIPAEIGKAIKKYNATYDTYYFGAPRIHGGHGTVAWYSEIISLHMKESDTLDTFIPLQSPPTRDAIFLFVDVNFDDFDALQALAPGGQVIEWADPRQDNQVYFKGYLLTKEQLRQLAQ